MEADGPLQNSRIEWSEIRDGNEWDHFVIPNGGSIFQLWLWKKLLESDGSNPFYMACRDGNGKIIAVCPFIYREGKILRYLESLPDNQTAGPVVWSRARNPQSVFRSLQKSVKFSLSNRISAFVINAYQPEVIEPMLALGFRHRVMNSGLFMLDLERNKPEYIWDKGFEKHDRQAVKYYGEQASFSFSGSEREYITLNRPNWKWYKGRLFRADFISKMMATLGDLFRIALVTDLGGTALAGVQMLLDPPGSPSRSVHLVGARYSPTRNIHSAITFVNWKAVNWANENGFRFVDFGTYYMDASSDPTHQFFKLKRRFSITLIPRYKFVLPTSKVSYSLARRMDRMP